jgi:PilZ domain
MNKRASRRKRLLKAGTIEFGDGAITCIVRNMSDTGALLDVATPVGIPHHFTLVLRANGHRMPCHVVWWKEKRIGIVFK